MRRLEAAAMIAIGLMSGLEVPAPAQVQPLPAEIGLRYIPAP